MVVVSSGNTLFVLEWSSDFKNKYKSILGKGGTLQQFIDSTILKQIEPYIPMMIGTATKSGIMHTKIGDGLLIWRTPYIRVIYYGKVMVDPKYQKGAFFDPRTGRFWSRPGIKKIVSARDIKFKKSRHPKAGSYWPKRYLADNQTRLEKAVNDKAGELWR